MSDDSSNKFRSSTKTLQTEPSYAESLLYHKKFHFQPRKGQLDLRGISQIDVDKVSREIDIDTLQLFLENITFSDVSEDDFKIYSDDCFAQLFRISQFTLEYLLNVQDTLAINLNALARKYSSKKRSIKRLTTQTEQQEETISRLRALNLSQQKTIEEYETLLHKKNSEHRYPDTVTQLSVQQQMETNTDGQGGSIHLYIIRWLAGKCLEISVPGSITVLELKKKIAHLTGVQTPLGEQSLLLKGVELADESPLYVCNVADESVLTIVDVEENKPSPQVEPQNSVLQNQAVELATIALNSQKELMKTTETLKVELLQGKEHTVQQELQKHVEMLKSTIRDEVRQELSLLVTSDYGPKVEKCEPGLITAAVIASSAGDMESDDDASSVNSSNHIIKQNNYVKLCPSQQLSSSTHDDNCKTSRQSIHGEELHCCNDKESPISLSTSGDKCLHEQKKDLLETDKTHDINAESDKTANEEHRRIQGNRCCDDKNPTRNLLLQDDANREDEWKQEEQGGLFEINKMHENVESDKTADEMHVSNQEVASTYKSEMNDIHDSTDHGSLESVSQIGDEQQPLNQSWDISFKDKQPSSEIDNAVDISTIQPLDEKESNAEEDNLFARTQSRDPDTCSVDSRASYSDSVASDLSETARDHVRTLECNQDFDVSSIDSHEGCMNASISKGVQSQDMSFQAKGTISAVANNIDDQDREDQLSLEQRSLYFANKSYSDECSLETVESMTFSKQLDGSTSESQERSGCKGQIPASSTCSLQGTELDEKRQPNSLVHKFIGKFKRGGNKTRRTK